MQLKSCFLVFTLSLASLSLFASPSLTTDLQKITDAYLKTHQTSEGLTGVSTSILIPADSEINEGDIHTVVAGTLGFPPDNQTLTSGHLFQIGSITKSFIAVLILQQETEGKLSLTDTLGKWLPQYENWKEVTIRQLLNMTSGIPNYSANPEFLARLEKEPSHVWTDEELIHYASPDKALTFKPGTAFDYCNTNYILAGLILEKAGKESLSSLLQKKVFAARPVITNPQGMAEKTLGSPVDVLVDNKPDGILTNTFYPAGPQGNALQESLLPRMAHGYYYDNTTKKMVDITNVSLSWAAAAGAIVASTNDVIKWVQMLYHGALIDPRYRENALAKLENVVSMKTGKSIITVSAQDPKGFGLGVGLYYDANSKQRFWVYEGSTLGYRVLYLWKSCNDVTTAVALNSKGSEGSPQSTMTDDILKLNLQIYALILKHYPQLKCSN